MSALAFVKNNKDYKMKTQHEKYLERMVELLDGMEDDAVPQLMQLFEAFALRYQKKVRLRLVVATG